jgi:hypothetical protein
MAAQLYQMIGGLGDDAFTGTQRARTLNLQKPILGPDGQPSQDLNTISTELLKRGGGEYAKELLPFLWKKQFLEQDQGGGAPQQQPQQQPNIGPSSSPHGQSPDMLRAAGQPQGGAQPSAPGDNAADTVRSIATETGGPNRDLSTQIPNYAKVLGVGPDDPLSPAQASRMRKIIGSNVNPTGQTAENNDTTPVGAGANPGGAGVPAITPPQQTVQQRFPAYPGGPPLGGGQTGGDPGAGMLPPGYQGDSRAFASAAHQRAEALRAQARREGIAGIPSKALEDQAASLDARATKIDEAWAKWGEPGANPQQQSSLKQSEAVGAAKGKRIGEVVEAGGEAARHTLNVLGVMEDALRHGGDNISTGPGAEGWLKVKQAVNNLFPDLMKGVPESETVQKLNAQLAAEAAKSMTARPSQLEFRAFMANNPGLLTSVKGSQYLISVLRQAKEQDIALGRQAMNAKNLDNWTDVEDKFYAQHPIKSPFTGKPLSGDEKVGLPPTTTGAAPPAAAIQHLKGSPALRDQFDAKYGPGSAAKVLGAGDRT